MHVECGLDNREESSLWKTDGMAEGGEDAGRARQIHGYDLDHIDLGVSDGRAVKYEFKTRNQPSPSFTQVVLIHTSYTCT